MIIIHGEDTTKSYERLIVLTNELKEKEVEVITHDVKELDLTNLRQEIGSVGLFGTGKCFVIKNFLTSSKSKYKDSLLDVIKQNTDHQIIFWENKGLTATVLKTLPQAKVESFAISPVIFKFLDSIRPNNTKTVILSWKKLLEEGIEPEFVFAMLVRQFKLLIQAKSGNEYLKLSPYPARLISTQASYFTLDLLLDSYHKLYEIDEKIKTGSTATTLDHLLSHFLQML
jgi:DNA polymerase III delta subunit